MLQNASFLVKIGADTAENEQHFAEMLRKIGNYPAGSARRRAAGVARRIFNQQASSQQSGGASAAAPSSAQSARDRLVTFGNYLSELNSLKE